jgi:hypothetical protein
VTISPLREYIQEWLKKSLIKIFETPTEGANIVNKTTTKKIQKAHQQANQRRETPPQEVHIDHNISSLSEFI